MKKISSMVLGSLVFVTTITSAQENPNQKEREERAIAAIEKLGGIAYSDEDIPGKPLIEVTFYKSIKDEDLKWLNAFPLLEALSVLEGRISDNGIALLKPLIHLKYLDVRNASISDAAIANLRGFISLQDLILIDVPITDAALPHLESMTHLRTVFIEKTKLSKKGIADLKVSLPYTLIDVQPETSQEAKPIHFSWKWPFIIGATSVFFGAVAF